MAKSVVFSTSSSVRSNAEAETSLSKRAFIDSLIESPRVGGFPVPVSADGSRNNSSPFNVDVEAAEESEEGAFEPGGIIVFGPWYLAELPRAKGEVGPRLNPDERRKIALKLRLKERSLRCR